MTNVTQFTIRLNYHLIYGKKICLCRYIVDAKTCLSMIRFGGQLINHSHRTLILKQLVNNRWFVGKRDACATDSSNCLPNR